MLIPGWGANRLLADNFYGTPKPPPQPSAPLPHVSEQLLPGATPTSEGKRKRNKSVSNMEKASVEPPEEEEEERAIVNGNGVAITPGQSAGSNPAGVTVRAGRAGQTQPMPRASLASASSAAAHTGTFSTSHNHMTRRHQWLFIAGLLATPRSCDSVALTPPRPRLRRVGAAGRVGVRRRTSEAPPGRER